jgi:hypothetical protein
VHVRAIVRRVGVVVGIAATVFGAVVCISGGFEITLSGVRVFRSHDWIRPFAAGALGWLIYAVAGGRFVLPPAWSANGARRLCDLAAGVLAAVTFTIGVVYLTTAVGGADSYGYASQADLWLQGRASIDQPWVQSAPWPNARATFTPLAWALSPDVDRPWTIVPTYPPGLPWLMAVGKAIGGQEGMFWVAPILASLMVLATYGIGCRLASPPAGLIAAWLVATSPVQLFMQMQAMSDGPAAGAWALAIYFLLGTTPRAALAAGLATALAIAIRPNLAFGAGVLGIWYLVRLWRAEPSARGAEFRRGLLYAAGSACGVAAVAAVYNALNGSPFRSGYGEIENLFSRDYIWPNMRDYLVWLVQTHTPAVLLGFVALALPIRAIWPAARDRAVIPVLAAFAFAIWAFYCYYKYFGAWWYLRFHLPMFPVLMAGVGAVLVALVRKTPPVGRVLATVLIIALGAYTMRTAREAGAFELWKADRHYPAVARMVRTSTERDSVIISMQHSGSVRYYGGRVTLRYDLLDPAWLDRAVEWLESRGIRPYLLIDNWEKPDVVHRFAGQHAIQQLERLPAAHYRGTTTVVLWDLSRRKDGVYPPTVEFIDDWSNSRAFKPLPLLIPFE